MEMDVVVNVLVRVVEMEYCNQIQKHVMMEIH